MKIFSDSFFLLCMICRRNEKRPSMHCIAMESAVSLPCCALGILSISRGVARPAFCGRGSLFFRGAGVSAGWGGAGRASLVSVSLKSVIVYLLCHFWQHQKLVLKRRCLFLVRRAAGLLQIWYVCSAAPAPIPIVMAPLFWANTHYFNSESQHWHVLSSPLSVKILNLANSLKLL